MEDISLNVINEEPLPKTVLMSVSAIVGKDGNKKVYVLFKDAKKMAELTAPEGKVLSNVGFSDEDITKLRAYVIREKEYIYSIAKKVSPFKAFMGMKQG